MSQNPYQSAPPSGYAPQAPVGKVKPTGVTVFAILCLLIGVMGLIGVCVSGAGFAMLPAAISLIENAPASEMPQDQKDIAVASLKLAQEGMGIQITMVVLGFVVALLLIISSIMALMGKSIGLFRIATLIASLFVLIRFAVTTLLVQIPMMEKLKEIPGVAEQQGLPPIVNLIIGGVIAFAMAGFYLWAHLYSKSAPVKSYFGS